MWSFIWVVCHERFHYTSVGLGSCSIVPVIKLFSYSFVYSLILSWHSPDQHWSMVYIVSFTLIWSRHSRDQHWSMVWLKRFLFVLKFRNSPSYYWYFCTHIHTCIIYAWCMLVVVDVNEECDPVINLLVMCSCSTVSVCVTLSWSSFNITA